MARASRSLTYATPEIIVTGSRCRIRCNAFADKPVLSANVENNGVSMSPSGSGIDFRCGCGPRGRPRFLAGSATVAQISAHGSALKQKSAHCSTSQNSSQHLDKTCGISGWTLHDFETHRAFVHEPRLACRATAPRARYAGVHDRHAYLNEMQHLLRGPRHANPANPSPVTTIG
jgi:hypothetical protein